MRPEDLSRDGSEQALGFLRDEPDGLAFRVADLVAVALLKACRVPRFDKKEMGKSER